MDTREKAYQFAVYSSVSFALVSILSVCVTLPMVYNYVQTMHENVRFEASYCKVSSLLMFSSCSSHLFIEVLLMLSIKSATARISSKAFVH